MFLLYYRSSGDETQVLTQGRWLSYHKPDSALSCLSDPLGSSLHHQMSLSSFQLVTSPSSAYKPLLVSPALDTGFPSPTSI